MKMFLALILMFTFAAVAMASGDESAPLVEKKFDYKGFTHKNLRDGKKVNLRDFAANKKLVLVIYFAAWCPNWHNEAPRVERLYEKYKNQGFDVIGVSEYASIEDTRKDLDDNKITFAVVTESESRDEKQKTQHYALRQLTGDTRNWGSPWNVFLEPAKLEKKGDVLSKTTTVVNGEIIEKDVEAFIRQKLGLPAIETKPATANITGKTEVCQPSTIKQ